MDFVRRGDKGRYRLFYENMKPIEQRILEKQKVKFVIDDSIAVWMWCVISANLHSLRSCLSKRGVIIFENTVLLQM